MKTRERGLEVKANTYRGGGASLTFYFFLQTGKVVEELSEFKYNTNIGIQLTNLSTLRCSDL